MTKLPQKISNESCTFQRGFRPCRKDLFNTPSFPQQDVGYSGKVQDKQQYKLLALDLDGVVRNSRGKVPARLVELLKRVMKRGFYVVIVTGKMLASSRHFALSLGIKNPIICNHGAIVGDPVKNRVFYEVRLPRYSLDIIMPMLKRFSELQCYFSLNNRIYMIDNPAVPPGKRYHDKVHFEPHKVYPMNTNLKKTLKFVPSKIIFYTPWGKERKYMKILRNHFQGRVNVYRTKPGNVELSPPSVSKGKALEKVINKLNIKPREVIAIGDEENDISMIRLAGLGVAMKNAVPSVKKVADYITQRTNDEGGVDEVIKKFILQK